MIIRSLSELVRKNIYGSKTIKWRVEWIWFSLTLVLVGFCFCFSTEIARLGTRCLSAVSAYDNTLGIIDTFDTAQAKFSDILNSPSLDAACDKIKSLAKAKELDSSLILLINSAWASAKESTTMQNEVS